jgi:hypothetical protein
MYGCQNLEYFFCPKGVDSSKNLSSVYLAFPLVCEVLWRIMVFAPKADPNDALELLSDCVYMIYL